MLFLLTLRKHLHHGYKACSEASRRNFFLTSFWAPVQRPTINYSNKSTDLILKSPKLIFVILHSFSISPLQGTSLLAETICLVQTNLWSWSLCQCSSWNWELRFQWDSAALVGAELEQPSRDFVSVREVQLSFSSSGTGNSVCQGLVCLPLVSPWLCQGTSPSSESSSAACRASTEEKALCEAESLQCDTSKNRYNTVDVNNQTKMCCLSKLGNFSLFLIEIQRT